EGGGSRQVGEVWGGGGAAAPAQTRPAGRPSIVPESRGTVPPQSRTNNVSPFAADSARKVSKPEMAAESAPASGSRVVPNSTGTTPVVMGANALNHEASLDS